MHKPAYIGRFAPTPSGYLHFGSLVAALASGAEVGTRRDGDLVCVDLTVAPGVPLPLPDLRASSCALPAPEGD